MSTGRNLEPSNKPNRFGQVRNPDKDFSAGLVPSSHESTDDHARSDVDSSRRSQHHTLGNTRNQSSPGDHIHDGVNGHKLGLYEMDPGNPGKTRPALVLTGAKGGNVALTNLIAMLKNFIDFTDNTT